MLFEVMTEFLCVISRNANLHQVESWTV